MVESSEEFEEFCALFRTKACDLLISFNNRTNLTRDEKAGRVPASEMIGVRIAFEARLIDGIDYSEFGSFCQCLSESMGCQRPTFDWALNLVLGKVGDDAHIILGVDEMLLGAGVSSYEDYLRNDESRLSDMLNALGVQLDKRKNVHIVLTSLSYQYFKEEETTSGRSLYAIGLRNLNFDESMALAEFFNRRLDSERTWINDRNAKQIVQDCDGAPRLLQNVFHQLKPKKTLEALRAMCNNIEPINKLNAKRDRLMVVALVLALRGSAPNQSEEMCFDEAVYMGYLLSSSVISDDRTVEPIFPLMTMWCLCEKSELKRADAAYLLWECIHSLLRLDSDRAGNRFSGASFEVYFRGLWRLRWTTRHYQVYSDRARGATARFPAAGKISLRHCLSSFELEPDISTPREDCTSPFDMLLKSPEKSDEMRQVSFCGTTRPYARVTSDQLYQSSVHQIVTPITSHEPGLDDIYTFPLQHQFVIVDGKRQGVGKRTALFVFQYNFSNVGASTTISNDDIARAFVLSVKTNFEVFEAAISQNLFGFVFVSVSHCNENVSANNVVMKIQQLAEDEQNLECREGIVRASCNIAIMKRHHVLRFFPKPLRSRPQFRLEEQ